MTNAFRRLTVSYSLTDVGEPCVKVAWALERGFKAPAPYAFELQRLYGPSDNEPVTVATGGDGHWMYDTAPKRPQMGNEWYYRVVLTDGDGVEHPSQAAPAQSYWSTYDWRIARAITRAEAMVMRKRAGAAGWLAKRRYWGEACPTCVDTITSQIDSVSCGTCYGTAFEQGYHPLIPCWVIIEQSQSKSALTPEGHDKQSLRVLRMLAYPPPETGDIWIQQHVDRRYRIGEQVTPIAQHRGIPLVFQVQVIELPESDVVYRIPTGECD